MWIVDDADVVAAVVVVVVVVVVVRLINVVAVAVAVAVAGINASRIASHNIASTKNNTLTNILLRTVLCSVVFLSFWTLLTVQKPYDDAVIRFIYIQHFTKSGILVDLGNKNRKKVVRHIVGHHHLLDIKI